MNRTTAAVLLTIGALAVLGGCENSLVGPRIAAFVSIGIGVAMTLAGVSGLTRQSCKS